MKSTTVHGEADCTFGWWGFLNQAFTATNGADFEEIPAFRLISPGSWSQTASDFLSHVSAVCSVTPERSCGFHSNAWRFHTCTPASSCANARHFQKSDPLLNANAGAEYKWCAPTCGNRRDTNPRDASRRSDSTFKTLWETPGCWIASGAVAAAAVQMGRGRDGARGRLRETRHSK